MKRTRRAGRDKVKEAAVELVRQAREQFYPKPADLSELRQNVEHLCDDVAETAKVNPGELMFQANRLLDLERIHRAIRDGRCYLNTAWGRRKVTGYSDETGWAVTNNRGHYTDQHSFMVCTSDFVICEEPVGCGA